MFIHKIQRVLLFLIASLFSVSSAGAVASVSNSCVPLWAPTGTILSVKNISELNSAITKANATGNVTILLEDGTYNLTTFLYVTAKNITVRSKSGDRSKVILRWAGMKTGNIPHVFLVTASNFTVADISLGNVKNHGIQVQWEKDADNLFVHNVRFFDTNEQMLKGSFDPKKPSIGSDNGVVECSLFEYSAGIGPQYYIGGIDVHNGKNWIVRNNTFKWIRSPESRVAEHAVHFWSNSANTVVDSNTIINCDRGVGFGLGNIKHFGGIIKNNLILHDTSKGDVGIMLESALQVEVYNNTVIQNHSYGNAIEYRFGGTTATIKNNLTNKAIAKRDGASAVLSNNITNAKIDWFKNPSGLNYALSDTSIWAKNGGVSLSSVVYDIRWNVRDATPDIGAFEGIWGVLPVVPPVVPPVVTPPVVTPPVITPPVTPPVVVPPVVTPPVVTPPVVTPPIQTGSIDVSKLTFDTFVKKYKNREITDKSLVKQLPLVEFGKDSIYRTSVLFATDKLSYELSPEQIRALDMSKGGIFGQYLTFEQLNAVSVNQIATMHGDNYGYLTAENIAKIPLDRIAKLSVWELSIIKSKNPSSLLGFTGEQIAAFTMSKGGIFGQYFTYEQFKYVTVEQMRTMHGDNFSYLSPENVARIPDERLQTFTTWELSNMKNRYNNLTGLTKHQLEILRAKNHPGINNYLKGLLGSDF